jgi:hypothetical protein
LEKMQVSKEKSKGKRGREEGGKESPKGAALS